MVRIVMSEDANRSTTCSGTVYNGCVIKFVTDQEVSTSHKCRNGCAVCVETHVQSQGIFLAQEFGDDFLHFSVQLGGSEFVTARTARHGQVFQRTQHLITTGDLPIIGKSQIVVTTKVQTRSSDSSIGQFYKCPSIHVIATLLIVVEIVQGSQQPHGLVTVITDTLQDLNIRSRTGGNGSIEAILNAMIQSARVKVFPRLEEGSVPVNIVTVVGCLLTQVTSLANDFGEQITNMTTDDQDSVSQVSGVGREERKFNVIRLFLLLLVCRRLFRFFGLVLLFMGRITGTVPGGQSLHSFTDIRVRVLEQQVMIVPVIMGKSATGGGAKFRFWYLFSVIIACKRHVIISCFAGPFVETQHATKARPSWFQVSHSMSKRVLMYWKKVF
mmetsp:Transcript_15186/g.26330  ORF Transcript_15186/g.26330 Transcript_15186/m.26330 type:complete len:384 (-) Transcript_15186:169-1320(-)